MTDLSPAAPSPMLSLPGLSEAQVASARTDWIGLGLDAAAFDAAATGAQVPIVPPSDPSNDPAAREGNALNDSLHLTDTQRQEMAQALLAAGVDKSAVEAALAADGAALSEDAGKAPGESPAPLEIAFRPAAPSDIRVDYIGRLAPDTDMDALAELNTAATTWASEVGFPAEIAAGVIERAIDAGHAYERMSEAQRQLWMREQTVAFERMAGGPDKAAEKLALAAKAISRGDKGFSASLYKSGALHDAGMILHLANQGERLAAGL